jgi:hypothetical protein
MRKPTMADDKAGARGRERQLRAATETLREAALGLLQAGGIPPPVLVLALARVTGEIGTATARGRGGTVEGLLGELAEAVRRAGLEHHATLQAEGRLVTRPRLTLT